MSKVKKVFAIILSMAMILGMSLTAFAANATATITVSGLASTGTNSVTYTKILQPNVRAEGGYEFVEGVSIEGYTGQGGKGAKAFLELTNLEQKELLKDATLPTGITGTVTGNRTFTATVEAGYYVIEATNTAGVNDPVVEYDNPMIVSIEYENATLGTDGTYTYDVKANDIDSSVTAKYTTIPITKTVTDPYVPIDGTATYTIETFIPSEVTAFSVTDTLDGGEYQQSTVAISIEGVDGTINAPITWGTNDDGNPTMTINLNSYVNLSGNKVTITYNVTVKSTVVENHAIPDDSKHTYTEAEEYVYTGALKFTKYGENNDPLKDAVFNVKDSNDNVLKFTLGEDGIYYLDADGEITGVTTGEDGTFTVYGLDVATYTIVEVQAPEGYSVNTTPEIVTITAANTTEQATLTPATGDMADTRLSSLPSTGGIGTTIFTVGGCVIMIAAAGLFFASRRKESK